MNQLTFLGNKFKTDKVDQHHTFNGITYTDIYYDLLKDMVNDSFYFLEIGVRDGESLRMWSEFFPNATIVGCDINPDCKVFERDNIKVEIGSQGDSYFLNYLVNKYKQFAVILDDGSHINDLTIASFDFLRNYVTCCYIIEDLRNSYEDLTEDVKSWPGMHLNKNTNFNNRETRFKLDKIFLDEIKKLDYRNSDFNSIKFYSQLMVFSK